MDFPRVLCASNRTMFAEMCRLESELIKLHLLRRIPSGSSATYPVLSTEYSVLNTCTGANLPAPTPHSPASAPHSALRPPHLPDAIANFRAGGYFALRKWLQPKHRSPRDPEYA